jgi:hypothetical protein
MGRLTRFAREALWDIDAPCLGIARGEVAAMLLRRAWGCCRFVWRGQEFGRAIRPNLGGIFHTFRCQHTRPPGYSPVFMHVVVPPTRSADSTIQTR